MATMATATIAAAGLKVASSLPFTHRYAHKLSYSSSWKNILSISSSSSSSPSFSIGAHHPRRHLFRPCFSTSPDVSTESAPAVSAPHVSAESAPDVSREKEIEVKDSANSLDIRVGRVIKAWRHEEADSLYVEEVDVGEAEPRVICSGLVKYVPIHLLEGASVVVLANLKPRNMRGVKSCGMLLAASDASHENVELLVPPEGALPGDRVWFGTLDDTQELPAPLTPNQIQKKKIWELVQPHLKTDASCSAMLGNHLMQTTAGVVTSKSLKDANIS